METAKHRTQISLEDWQYQILLEMSKRKKEPFIHYQRVLV